MDPNQLLPEMKDKDNKKKKKEETSSDSISSSSSDDSSSSGLSPPLLHPQRLRCQIEAALLSI